MMQLTLYSKPGCHLCEGLEEKLRQVSLELELEVRDITTREDWWQRFEYEVPVLFMAGSEVPLPRFSPRASVQQITQLLQKYLLESVENS